jgi:hypothetical protein
MLVPVPVRRFLAVGLWLCVTAVATAIVWAGTSTVAADLTDRPPPVVALRDVVEALQPGEPGAETDPGITTPGAGGPTSTVAPGGRRSAAPVGDAPAGGASGSAGQPPSVALPAPTTAPPTTRPSSPPTTQAPQRPTATFSTAGGSATVGCSGPFYFFADLIAATPNNGYAVNVVSAGPYYVEVHFVRPGRDEPLWAYCLGQPVRAYGRPDGSFGR